MTARRRGRHRDVGIAELREPLERDLDVRRRQVLADLLRLAERAALGAGERVALAQRVEHLSAHAPRGVRAERRAEVAAVPPCRLHQTEDAPRDEILAVGAAAARVEGSGSDRSREPEVRDDAFLDRRALQPLPSPRG